MRMLDPRAFRFTGEADYMAHLPIFYDLLRRSGRGSRAVPRPWSRTV